MHSITVFYEYMGAAQMKQTKADSLEKAKQAFLEISPPEFIFKGAVFTDSLMSALKLHAA